MWPDSDTTKLVIWSRERVTAMHLKRHLDAYPTLFVTTVTFLHNDHFPSTPESLNREHKRPLEDVCSFAIAIRCVQGQVFALFTYQFLISCGLGD